MIIYYCRASMFLQGSDLLHACNKQANFAMALFFAYDIVPLSLEREREEREEKSFVEGGQINPRYLPYVFSE